MFGARKVLFIRTLFFSFVPYETEGLGFLLNVGVCFALCRLQLRVSFRKLLKSPLYFLISLFCGLLQWSLLQNSILPFYFGVIFILLSFCDYFILVFWYSFIPSQLLLYLFWPWSIYIGQCIGPYLTTSCYFLWVSSLVFQFFPLSNAVNLTVCLLWPVSQVTCIGWMFLLSVLLLMYIISHFYN